MPLNAQGAGQSEQFEGVREHADDVVATLSTGALVVICCSPSVSNGPVPFACYIFNTTCSHGILLFAVGERKWVSPHIYLRLRWRIQPLGPPDTLEPEYASDGGGRGCSNLVGSQRSTQVDFARVTKLNCSGALCVYIAEGLGLHRATR
jgi:hypothetical protein